jgi:hypothetical protein
MSHVPTRVRCPFRQRPIPCRALSSTLSTRTTLAQGQLAHSHRDHSHTLAQGQSFAQSHRDHSHRDSRASHRDRACSKSFAQGQSLFEIVRTGTELVRTSRTGIVAQGHSLFEIVSSHPLIRSSGASDERLRWLCGDARRRTVLQRGARPGTPPNGVGNLPPMRSLRSGKGGFAVVVARQAAAGSNSRTRRRTRKRRWVR